MIENQRNLHHNVHDPLRMNFETIIGHVRVIAAKSRFRIWEFRDNQF